MTGGFEDGTGSILLDDVQCSGDELTLISCPSSPLGQHNCDHMDDAGVQCRVATRGKYVCICWQSG